MLSTTWLSTLPVHIPREQGSQEKNFLFYYNNHGREDLHNVDLFSGKGAIRYAFGPGPIFSTTPFGTRSPSKVQLDSHRCGLALSLREAFAQAWIRH